MSSWSQCPLFVSSRLEPSFLPRRLEARFPSGEEWRQKREIKNCHRCLVNTVSRDSAGDRDEGEAGLRRGGWERRVGIGEERDGALGRSAPLALPQSLSGWAWAEGGLPGEERDERVGPELWRGIREEGPDGRCQASEMDTPHSCGTWHLPGASCTVLAMFQALT